MEVQFNKIIRNYLFLFGLIIAFLAILAFALITLSSKYYDFTIMIISIMSVVILIYMIFCLSLISYGYKSKYFSPQLSFIIKNFIIATYPFLILLPKIFKTDKKEIKKFYIEINNIIVNSVKYEVKPDELLILTPHCLQDSSCTVKVTNNPYNCKRCGKCNVSDLIRISEKHGVNLQIATGGTFARKVVSDIKPKYIIAIACERDLLSGIQEVKGIPVMGISNLRPNGPCFNTKIEIDKVEQAILNIIE